jgi:probable O-glycosylation ligase (exosortase A-associated)
MRGIFLIAVVAAGLLATLAYPYAGVLLWTWFTCMDPHQDAYGFAQSAPFNLIIACVTIAAWLFSKERKVPPIDVTFVLIFAFLIWITLNGFLAVDPVWSWPLWDRAWKTVALGLMIMVMATSKTRLHSLIWAVVVSLLYYGIKGGIFTIVSGGQSHVLGPSNTMIGDNNQLALALLMILPLANYLRIHTADRRLSLGLAVAMVLTTVSIIGSYSRGAFLALAALAAAAWLRSKRKMLYLLSVVAVAVPLIYFMPQSYYDRINTLQSADTDSSFQGRVTSWRVAFNYARDHFPFGNGFAGSQRPAVYNFYFPNQKPLAAHSVYFEVLGDNGFIGLAIYLAIIVVVFLNCRKIRKLAHDDSGLAWADDMAQMIQLSLFVFCVGGAALSMAYYDVFFIWVGLISALLFQLRHAVLEHNKSRTARTSSRASAALAETEAPPKIGGAA